MRNVKHIATILLTVALLSLLLSGCGGSSYSGPSDSFNGMTVNSDAFISSPAMAAGGAAFESGWVDAEEWSSDDNTQK